MKESIHKRLTEHIRKTVGRYEVPYEPGSWEEFRRLQRKQRQRIPLIVFRYALAACLLLGLLGVPLWLYIQSSAPVEVVINRPKSSPSVPSPGSEPAENHRSDQTVFPTKPSTDIAHTKPLNRKSSELNQPYTAWNTTLPNPKSIQKTPSPARQLAKAGQRTAGGSGPKEPSVPGQTGGLSDEVISGLEKHVTVASAAPVGRFDVIPLRSGSVYRWLVRPLGLPLKAYTEEWAAQTARQGSSVNPIFGVSLAPQSVYAPGSSPHTGVGGGVFSEIPLNRQLSVSTGLSMARQVLGTREPVIFTMVGIPSRVATDVRLVAVDLPVNVRFRPFKSSQTGFYAEAGLSSLAFLTEQYADVYQQVNPVTVLVMGANGEEQAVTQYVTQQETVNRSEPAFQKIYWGRIINLSIGVERRLGDRLRLSAEPYLKYPVGPLTRENLLLGSGGINLRLGFQAGRSSR